MTRLRQVVFTLALWFALIGAGCASEPPIDEEFPPGNPALEDRTSDGGRGFEGLQGDSGHDDTTDYVLLSILAVCLIGAGTLLVRVERWERRRAAGSTGAN